MHILQIYKDYFPVLGGIENHVKVLAEGLTARGHRCTVLVTNPTKKDEIIQKGNLTIIKAGRLVHLASTPLSLKMFWYARQLKDVDIIHLQHPYPPGDLAALAVPNQPPLVISYQSDIVRQRFLLQIYGPLLQQTLKRASRLIASSPAYIESSPWLKPHAAKCIVIPPSVDPERFAKPDLAKVAALQQQYGAPLLLFVGRLRYYKGLHFLLEALPFLQNAAHLLLVGTGPEEQRLKKQVEALGLSEKVHFLGEIADENLPNIYGAADIFVLPSHLRAEAFGIVLLEAQATGLPIVCTELGTGTSYITLHEKTGLVVPPADPRALATALDTLLASPLQRQKLGEAGRIRAKEEFSHAKLLERIEQLYLTLL